MDSYGGDIHFDDDENWKIMTSADSDDGKYVVMFKRLQGKDHTSFLSDCTVELCNYKHYNREQELIYLQWNMKVTVPTIFCF
jgi:hypothetical protein